MRICERDVDEEFFTRKGEAHAQHATSKWSEIVKGHFQFAGSLISNYLPSCEALRYPDRFGGGGVKGPAQILWENAKTGFQDRAYNRKALNDILIGLSIGAMCIPQGMSYASLAGMPMQYGLYSNLVHPLGYFLFGTSNHVVTGSAAIENLMIGESLDNVVNTKDVEARQRGAILLSLMCSCLYLAYRFTGMAIVSDLLADPVLSGFATGSSFLVAASQLKYALGLPGLKSQWSLPHSLYYILSNLTDICMAPLIACALSVIFLVLCRQVKRRFIPGPLILVISSILISKLVDLNGNYGIQIVGHIPKGIPHFINEIPRIHWFGDIDVPGMDTLPSFRQLFWESVKISCLLFVIHVSIAKTIAIRQEYQIKVADELLAFSMMNGLGCVIGGCYPGSTSISRSAASEGLGCTVGLQGPSSSCVVILVLLFLTDWLRFLPLPCLCAIVLIGISNSLVEFNELFRLWRLQKTAYNASTSGSSPDLLLWIIAFVITFCFGASEGIIVSVILSLVWIGKSILRPPFIELGRIKDTTIYRDIRRFPGLIDVDPAIAIFRIDAPLNFCNSSYLERHIRQVIDERFSRSALEHVLTSNSATTVSEEHKAVAFGCDAAIRVIEETRDNHFFFILDCSSINGLDITSIGAIKRIVKHAANHRVIVAFSNWKGPQRDFLWRANFYDVVPPQRCFLSNHDAYLWANAVRSHPFVATEILRPMIVHRRNDDPAQMTFTKTLTQTLTRNLSPPNTSLYGYRQPDRLVATEEIELGRVYEWDGLSALVPNVRVVEEQTAFGGSCRWEVSAIDDD